jgi:hypothetical protein
MGGGTIGEEKNLGSTRRAVRNLPNKNTGATTADAAKFKIKPSVTKESNCPSKSKSVDGVREKSRHTPMHNKMHRWIIPVAVAGSFVLNMLYALLK